MVYNADNSEKIEQVPAGEVVDGVVIAIQDSTPRNLIKSQGALLKFKNLDEPAINVVVECKYKGKVFRPETMFTYVAGDNGKTLYTANSNIAKYVTQYGHLPKVNDVVKLVSNSQGYFKIIVA